MRRGAAALLVAGVLAGCGASAKDASRHHVDAYIARVDRVEVDAAATWGRVQRAYGALGRGSLTPAKVRALARAPRAIRALRGRVAGVDPPPEALALRASLLRLLDADGRLADQVASFGSYVSAVTPLEQELGAATKALRSGLRAQRSAAGQERVLAAYGSRVAGAERRLAALRPPPALAPWHREQAARFRSMRRGAVELRHGLAAGDRAVASRGFTVLRDAVSQPAVTAADRAAIVAYNAGVAHIARLSADVARAQNALQKRLA